MQKRRSQNYRRQSGSADLDVGLVIAVGVKFYTHVLGVFWVGVDPSIHGVDGHDR